MTLCARVPKCNELPRYYAATLALVERSSANICWPAHLFFLLVAPESMTATHLKALARISRLCLDSGFRARLLSASDAAEMLVIVEAEEAEHEKIGGPTDGLQT